MDKPLLKVCGLKKSFGGVEVLHSIDFIAEAGKVTALVGENGAGKSTLLRHITGIYRPDSGSILIDGEPVLDNSRAKSKFAYIPGRYFFIFFSPTLWI